MTEKPDDIDLFLDHWIIIRPDGTPILNGRVEEFEEGLRTFIRENKEENYEC